MSAASGDDDREGVGDDRPEASSMAERRVLPAPARTTDTLRNVSRVGRDREISPGAVPPTGPSRTQERAT